MHCWLFLAFRLVVLVHSEVQFVSQLYSDEVLACAVNRCLLKRCCMVFKLSCQKVISFKFEIWNFWDLFQMGIALRVTPAGTWLTVHRRLSVLLQYSLGSDWCREDREIWGKICIVSCVWLSVSIFGIFRSSILL